MRRLSRNPKQIETLNFHAAVDVPAVGEQRLTSHPARVAATVAQFEAGLRDSLATPSRIRGWVSDQLFGLIAADLGGCNLVKQEDTGVLFYDGEVKLPDWRLTLLSGQTILVEVKAVDDEDPRVAKLRPAEVARLKSYADTESTPLYLAVNWVAMSIWTLVPIDDLTRIGSHFEIDLTTALKRDRMGSLLNDRWLGLVPPLEFRMALEEDHNSQGQALPTEGVGGDSLQLSLVVKGVRLFGGGQEMLEEREKNLVWFLLLNGTWVVDEAMQELGDGAWEMVFTAAPEVEPDEQPFALIGKLSQLYTRMFASSTTSPEGDGTTQLSLDIEPGTLPELVPTDFNSVRLPLWHLHQQPADGPEAPQ